MPPKPIQIYDAPPEFSDFFVAADNFRNTDNEEGVLNSPDEFEEALKQACVYMFADEYTEAQELALNCMKFIAYIKTVANYEYNEASTLSAAGRYYLTRGKDRLGMDNLQQAIAKNPNLPDAHFGVGLLFLKQNKFSSALDKFEKATKLDPSYAKAHYYRAITLQELGRYLEAEDEFLLSYEVAPDRYNGGNAVLDGPTPKLSSDRSRYYTKTLTTIESFLALIKEGKEQEEITSWFQDPDAFFDKLSRMIEKESKRIETITAEEIVRQSEQPNWPKTPERAANIIISSWLSKSDKDFIKSAGQQKLSQFNSRLLGTLIRYKFGLRRENEELLKACSPDLDPQKASEVIINMVWKKLQN